MKVTSTIALISLILLVAGCRTAPTTKPDYYPIQVKVVSISTNETSTTLVDVNGVRHRVYGASWGDPGEIFKINTSHFHE